MKGDVKTVDRLSESVEALDKEISTLDELADIEEIFDAIVEALIAAKLVRDDPYDLREALDELCDKQMVDAACLQAIDDVMETSESTSYQDHQEKAETIKAVNLSLKVLLAEMTKLIPVKK